MPFILFICMSVYSTYVLLICNDRLQTATAEQLERALKQRNKKYGFKARLSGLFSRTKGDLIGFKVSLD